MIERACGLDEPKALRRLTDARLLQLMLQDEDLKLAKDAAAELRRGIGVGQPINAVQVNVTRDAAVVESLKTLQIEEEDAQEKN
jgi:hypothetical protein